MYVLSVKRIKDCFNHSLETPEWVYAQYDNHAGSFSTGYPIFSNRNYAIVFKTVEEAKEWYDKNKTYLEGELNHCDRSTLAVRKEVYKTVHTIEA